MINGSVDQKAVDSMIDAVENIIREKVRDDFDSTKANDRKVVSKEILKKLDEVMENEN